MLDPNFQRSAVLLCEHNDEDGTVGYVLNQPATIKLSDVMSEFPDADGFPIFLGGPVARIASTSSISVTISSIAVSGWATVSIGAVTLKVCGC